MSSRKNDGIPEALPDVPAFLASVKRRTRSMSIDRNLIVGTDLEHNVIGVRSLPQRKPSYEKRSRLAYDVLAPMLEQMLPPRGRGEPPTGIGFVVRLRAGRAVITQEDEEWRYTLLWACGAICCFTGDVVIVTPHGWRVDRSAGWEPRLSDLCEPRLRAVECMKCYLVAHADWCARVAAARQSLLGPRPSR